MINPRARRQDKIGLKALKKNVIPEKDLPDTVRNPMTQRCIKANGKVHKELMAKGVLPHPKTKHCTRLYKKLVRCGVKFHDDDLHPKKTGGAPQCKNEATFMLTNVSQIVDEDLLVTPSGYCFSITEIVEWIKSKSFTNINPHVNETLFNDLDNIEDLALKNALSEYFKEQRIKRDRETDIITTHLDTFYLICKTGGICYFDQLHNFVQHNSGAFEASIEAITNLMTTINSISEAERTVFLNLQSYAGETLTNIIHSANAGTMCIHGVGTSLLSIFVRNYLNTERKNKQQIQPYDPLVTCIHFFIEKCGLINFTSMNSRQSIKSNTPYHKSITNKFRITEQDKTTSTLFRKTDKSQHVCKELLGIPDWRKIQLKDGNCFDLLDLIRTMTEMLNTTNGINPSPIYPMITDTEDLKAIRRRIIQNYITVSMPLQTFLMNPEELWSRSIDPHKWREKCIKFFESNMRYVREFKSYNPTDGLSIIGFWDKKQRGRSFIETLIIQQLERVNKDLMIFSHKRLQSYTLDKNYYFNSNVINTKEITYDNTGLTDDAKDDDNDLWA